MAKAEFEDNHNFNFYHKYVIKKMLKIIEEFVEETKFKRIIDTMKEYNDFKRKGNESEKVFIGRFSNLKIKLMNIESGMSNSWLAGFLLDRCKLSKAEKNNILAILDIDNENAILKNLEKKIRH